MAICVECNTKVGLLSSFKHPIKGKKHAVCSHCYEAVEMQVSRNREQAMMDINVIEDIQPGYFPVLSKSKVVL